MQLQYLDVRNPKDIEAAFSAAGKGRADAVLVLASPVFNVQRKQIIDLAVRSRLPVVYYAPEWVQDGGLISYGMNYTDLYRRAATYVDKILKAQSPLTYRWSHREIRVHHQFERGETDWVNNSS